MSANHDRIERIDSNSTVTTPFRSPNSRPVFMAESNVQGNVLEQEVYKQLYSKDGREPIKEAGRAANETLSQYLQMNAEMERTQSLSVDRAANTLIALIDGLKATADTTKTSSPGGITLEKMQAAGQLSDQSTSNFVQGLLYILDDGIVCMDPVTVTSSAQGRQSYQRCEDVGTHLANAWDAATHNSGSFYESFFSAAATDQARYLSSLAAWLAKNAPFAFKRWDDLEIPIDACPTFDYEADLSSKEKHYQFERIRKSGGKMSDDE